MKFFYFLSVICFLSFSVSAEDLNPPELVSFALSTTEVDVTEGEQQLLVTFRITDEESGADTPYVTANSQETDDGLGFAEVSLIDGDIYDGLWEAVFTVPEETAAGLWSVVIFPLNDLANNSTGEFEPGDKFDADFTVISNVTDTTVPVLQDFSLSTTAVDVTDGPAQLIVTLHITDSESGVEQPFVVAHSSVNDDSTGFGEVTLISGDIYDGVWQAVLTIPQNATQGTWTVSVFPLADLANNSNDVFGPGDAYVSSFEVTSSQQDTTPPELVEFSLSKSVVYTGEAAQQLVVTMRITDDISGVESPNVTAHSEANDASTGFADVELVSGDLNDGVWEATLTLPQQTTSGTWSVTVFPLSDLASNSQASFGPGDGFNANFIVSNDAYVTVLAVESIEDINGDQYRDVLILKQDSANKVSVEVYNSMEQRFWDSISWPNPFEDPELVIFEDLNGNGTPELGIFGVVSFSNKSGELITRPQLLIKDIKNGSTVTTLNWSNNWSDIQFVRLSDLTGDGVRDVALFGRFKEGNRPQLLAKDLIQGTALKTYGIPNLLADPQGLQLSDMDGDGTPDVGFYGRLLKNNKPHVKVLSGRDQSKLASYNFADNWVNTRWYALPDIDQDGEPDWGLFGVRKNDNKPQLFTKKGNDNKGTLGLFSWPTAMENTTFMLIPDFNLDGLDDVAVFGYRPDADRYQLLIKDITDRNVLIKNINWPNKWSEVVVTPLQDYDGDQLVEIALIGQDVTGNWILNIKSGSGSQLTELTLGDNWLAAPVIEVLHGSSGTLLLTGVTQNGEFHYEILTL